ncbi:MAG: DUF1788 domain-containing protein [Fusobacterium sp.]|uniref:DUF1788 domain-containing protein n=1 Tax=Fusobacterium sp. TaxID=68766 RepID=UPI002A765AFB|nr:DUF1788 domain-containing protein [Fusobacterium sp.]MDY2980258.1 DUF1788 domain-containing protein [Fusobacterium sp.]
MKNINERFKGLIKKVKSEDFYNNRGLANEVPFYIFDYDPKDELIVRENIRSYFLKEVAKSEKLKAIEIDLFDLLLESLKNDGIFDLVFQMEERRGSQVLYEKLKNSFNIEVILEYIKEKSKDKNFVIITGVGKIFPVVRTHALLHNLQNIFNETKVLLFFPGEYTTRDLRLFGFKDNNYYRAFKI